MIEHEQSLVHGLHPEFILPHLHLRVDLVDLVLADQIADRRVGDHDLEGQHPTPPRSPRDQSLGEDPLEDERDDLDRVLAKAGSVELVDEDDEDPTEPQAPVAPQEEPVPEDEEPTWAERVARIRSIVAEMDEDLSDVSLVPVEPQGATDEPAPEVTPEIRRRLRARLPDEEDLDAVLDAYEAERKARQADAEEQADTSPRTPEDVKDPSAEQTPQAEEVQPPAREPEDRKVGKARAREDLDLEALGRELRERLGTRDTASRRDRPKPKPPAQREAKAEAPERRDRDDEEVPEPRKAKAPPRPEIDEIERKADLASLHADIDRAIKDDKE